MMLTVENLKVSVNEHLNDKEDMIAMHQSDATVKEHLIQSVNEHEKINMEKTTEILFLKRKIQELLSEKVEIDEVRNNMTRDLSEVRLKMGRDIKLLKDRLVRVTEENG
jgi:hypothetical protein